MEGADWRIGDLDIGVYLLLPQPRVWEVNQQTGVRVRRRGFFLVPDFAATAHLEQGKTEPAIVVHFPHGDHAPKPDDMIAANVSISRVRRTEAVLII